MCTFEQIQEANKSIKTTDIKGREYAEVNQRIKAFRMIHPNGCISTDLISNENGVCVFRAQIYDEDMNLLGVGHAFEKADSSFINKTSFIENCETSAIGRALGMCGFGIDTSVASYEEVANAIENQVKNTKKPVAVVEAEMKTAVLSYINKNKMSTDDVAKLCRHYGVSKVTELSADNCKDYINKLSEKGIKIYE